MEYTDLISKAINALNNAYAPYSQFKVGAALLCSDGTVFTGCNIENSSYGATCCAERTAVFSAINGGHLDFECMCIVGGKDGKINDFCPPCGICRQVLSEHCAKDFKIILYNGKESKVITLGELFPMSFSGDLL